VRTTVFNQSPQEILLGPTGALLVLGDEIVCLNGKIAKVKTLVALLSLQECGHYSRQERQ
jgi:hypothetical protein